MQKPGLGFENGAIWCKLCPETILEQTEPTQRGRALAGGSPVAPGHIEIRGSGGAFVFVAILFPPTASKKQRMHFYNLLPLT